LRIVDWGLRIDKGRFESAIRNPQSAIEVAVKILIAGGGTGGHVMPALALARAAAEAGHEPVLAGAERGIEAQILPHYPFPFHLLPIEPLYRRAWWRNVRWPVIAVRAWRAAGRVLARERPAIVIGTGGYAAGPLVWRAQRAGIPTVLQEQNAFPGITTRLLARRARQVHLGFPEARARLRPGAQTVVFTLGNPIAPPEPIDRAAALASFGLAPSPLPGRPTLLVVGGSQGARALNEAVAGALRGGRFGDLNVVWGTGSAHHSAYATLAVPGRVVVRGFFDPIAPAYAAADLVVCRAGAMTVSELCAWAKPSVLVPLPSAAADHQTTNARALADAGAAVLLAERELSAESLARVVVPLARDNDRLASLADTARGRGHPEASRAIMSNILTLVS
jgi:UDP-N-acetylglucosamine--N-acetylmuramyl-(pentapeptide) pyrophosphoryl-undecaprenol N-acetylglucosamine transferase